MLAVLFGIKCKKKVLTKQHNAKKSASTFGKSLEDSLFRSNDATTLYHVTAMLWYDMKQ